MMSLLMGEEWSENFRKEWRSSDIAYDWNINFFSNIDMWWARLVRGEYDA